MEYKDSWVKRQEDKLLKRYKVKVKKEYSSLEEVYKGYDRVIRTSNIMMWFCGIVGVILIALLFLQIFGYIYLTTK